MSNCHLHLIQKAAISTAYKEWMPSRSKKKKIWVTMARILGNTFFMEARLSTKVPSMIAMLVNSGSMSLEKEQEEEGQWMGMRLLWNHLVRRRQTKSKLAKQVLKYIDCYKCKRQMHTCCVLKHKNINYDKKLRFWGRNWICLRILRRTVTNSIVMYLRVLFC